MVSQDQFSNFLPDVIQSLNEYMVKSYAFDDIKQNKEYYSKQFHLYQVDKDPETKTIFNFNINRIFWSNLLFIDSENKYNKKSNMVINDRYTDLVIKLKSFSEICITELNFPMVAEYILQQIAFPSKKKYSFSNDMAYLTDILKKTFIVTMLETFENQTLKEKVKELAFTKLSLGIYKDIDNCLIKDGSNGFDEKETQDHLTEIINNLFDLNRLRKANFIQNCDEAETCFDGHVYIHQKFFNSLDQSIRLANLVLIILHEISHVKRIIYSSNYDYLKKTPGKFVEMGNYFEAKIGVSDFNNIDPDIFLDKDNWVAKFASNNNQNLNCKRGGNVNVKCRNAARKFESSIFLINREFNEYDD